MKKNGYRYCKKCDTRLQKWGKHASGTVRWRCPKCKISRVLKRHDIKNIHAENRLEKWVLSNRTQSELGLNSRTFRRSIKEAWGLHLSIPETGEVHKIILIDGIHIGDECCLIARTPKYVIGWLWCRNETSESWGSLFVKFPSPEYVVCDGQNGMLQSIRNCWKDAKIQRCLFHVMKNIRSKLTLHPKTDAGIILLDIARDLMKVDDEMSAIHWTKNLMTWYEKFKDFLNEKTRTESNEYVKYKRTWWFTHKNLRSAYGQLSKLLSVGHLFTFIDKPQDDVPTTTNYLEGDINSQLRRLLKTHRGMKQDHQKKLVEEYLYSRSEFGVKKET